VETDNYVLIFDYYNDLTESDNKNSSSGVIGEEDLYTSKKVIVFATHSHGDHFSEVIFKWREKRPDIKYILSSDIKDSINCSEVRFISAYEELAVDDLKIKSYGSTDLGISILVAVDGVNLFHAGDLNWWHWYDESDEENAKMEIMFKKEIEKIKKEKIDIAFFPVDPRLRESYVLGPEYFIREIMPKALVPMHFREDYSITKEFRNNCTELHTRIYEINRRGEELIFS
jgi:L-ascorbate metabolism protein UlaG (beta-lactamase superfamily)